MEQTGLIIKPPSPTDKLAGDLDYEVRLENGDWKNYEPTGERQNNPFVFDTKACVTFSFLNTLEAQLKFFAMNGKLPQTAINFLVDNGYASDNDLLEFNFSDKFLAIMSGTTKDGNDMVKVADTARNIGLIPQRMLPFGNAETWEAWHNPSQVTPAMIRLAAEFKKHFTIAYEWIFFDSLEDFQDEGYKACQKALKHAPAQAAIPVPATHAVVLSSLTPKKEYRIFNSYEPYGQVKEWKKSIQYALKVVITPLSKPIMNKYKYFSEKEVVGLNHEFVLMLDRARGFAGIPFVITSGYRDEDQNEQAGGVADSAHMKGLAADLRCRNSRERFKIVSGLMMAGFTRIGVGDTFVHCDFDASKDQEVVWLY